MSMEAKDYLAITKDLTPETMAGILAELEQAKTQLREANAEIERLRGALQRISNKRYSSGSGVSLYVEMAEIADEALQSPAE